MSTFDEYRQSMARQNVLRARLALNVAQRQESAAAGMTSDAMHREIEVVRARDHLYAAELAAAGLGVDPADIAEEGQ